MRNPPPPTKRQEAFLPDRLGQQAGMTAEAIKSYQRAVELRPDWDRAKEQLELLLKERGLDGTKINKAQ